MILNVNTLTVTWRVFLLSQPSGPGVLCAHRVAVVAAITACNKTNCPAVIKVDITVVERSFFLLLLLGVDVIHSGISAFDISLKSNEHVAGCPTCLIHCTAGTLPNPAH